MRSAFITYPKACLLHAIGLAGLMVAYQQIQTALVYQHSLLPPAGPVALAGSLATPA